MNSLKDYKYTVSDFADVLNVSKQTIYNWEKENILSSLEHKKGNRIFRSFSINDLLDVRNKLGIAKPINDSRVQIFLNFKGGTGKTSVCYNYIANLSTLGLNVLAIDGDPQAHLTNCLGYPIKEGEKTIFDVLINKTPIEQVIHEINPTLHLIPSNLELTPIEMALQVAANREYRLRDALKPIFNKFDIICLDLAPNIGLFNVNAIIAANEIIVPVMTDFLSYHGLKLLMDTLKDLEEDYKQNVEFSHKKIRVLANNFDSRDKICREALGALQRNYPDLLLNTVVRKNTALKDATKQQEPIFIFSPSSTGSDDISDLTYEILGITKNKAAKEI